MFKHLLAWPADLHVESFDGLKDHYLSLVRKLRLDQHQAVEQQLLSQLAGDPSNISCLLILAQLRWQQSSFIPFELILQKLLKLAPDNIFVRWFQIQELLRNSDLDAIDLAGPDLWQGIEENKLLQLARIAFLLQQSNLAEAEALLNQLPKPLPLEALRLKAHLLKQQGDSMAALAELQPALQRAPTNLPFLVQFLELVIDVKAASLALPTARLAIGHHGEHPDLLSHICTLKLYQRQPGLARRAALIQQAWASVRPTRVNASNIVNTYEQTGVTDWLDFLHKDLASNPLAYFDLHVNRTLQLASIQSPHLQQHLSQFTSAITSTPAFVQHLNAGSGVPHAHRSPGKSLRIAWITSDLTPHPVSRFLLGFLQASIGQRIHQHLVVSMLNHGSEANTHQFANLPGVDVVDVSMHRDHQRVAAIRALKADVAIDLSGWTGGNFFVGFLARLAPVQVNYLGYFATSGLPTMDYWLGDSSLFPAVNTEWHTETLWRLDRPFIAWQPPLALPEGNAQVCLAPSGPLRFGSFNHTRKLSDQTLRLWASILRAIPGSLLVLKANADSDQVTQQLLRQRMVQQGFDPERVEWLPLTLTSEEHLQQYCNLDIALDPIPNGGCTTTCEALWMGVPVITLAGSAYVSRMSTAVLHGAGLSDWVCDSEQTYLALALKQASQLSLLRSNRGYWRQKILTSPLGDAADLMRHLERAFLEMHSRALTGPSH